MVQSLCKQYSPPLLSLEHPFSPTEMLTYYPFPSPSALADPSVGPQLRALGFGYRADYVQRTAKMLVDSHSSKLMTLGQPSEASEIWLRQLRMASTEEARQELLKFIGVGRKVADCVLLMSLDKVLFSIIGQDVYLHSTQKEVVPVDTHVHQIAIKHYGFKGSISGKTTMTPKLYEEMNLKFFSIWGDYAGWAHTVSPRLSSDLCDFLLTTPSQVLFTADLKSFSSYGLPSVPVPLPTARTSKKKGSKSDRTKDNSLPTPPITPSRSPLKRKSELEFPCELETPSTPVSQLCIDATESLSIVDRIKRRRRG